MSNKGQLTRGEKWSKALDKAKFNKDNHTLKFFENQESILNDIEVYQNSLKPKTSKKEK